MRGIRRLASSGALFAIAGALLAGCGGDDSDDSATDSGGAGGGTLNVAIVDNPQMKDIAVADARAVHQGERHQGQLHGPRRGHAATGDHA